MIFVLLGITVNVQYAVFLSHWSYNLEFIKRVSQCDLFKVTKNWFRDSIFTNIFNFKFFFVFCMVKKSIFDFVSCYKKGSISAMMSDNFLTLSNFFVLVVLFFHFDIHTIHFVAGICINAKVFSQGWHVSSVMTSYKALTDSLTDSLLKLIRYLKENIKRKKNMLK